jgi:uncharacterized peroxidase-related enzyme
MARIAFPDSIEAAPEASRTALAGVRKAMGAVPNMFRMLANSPAALRGFLGLQSALAHGTLTAQTRERIALAVSEINGCDYCLSGHTFLGRQAKLNDAEITANRNGASNDPHAESAVRFAAKIARARGHLSDADVTALRQAGFSDGQMIEIIGLVAMNTFANYVNQATGTDIDFPVVTARRAA